MPYRCNICGDDIKNRDAFIAHSRREHADNGYPLWDAIEECGDAFSKTIIEHIQSRLRSASDAWERERHELKAKADAYDRLAPRWNRLARATQAIRLALDLSEDDSRPSGNSQ